MHGPAQTWEPGDVLIWLVLLLPLTTPLLLVTLSRSLSMTQAPLLVLYVGLLLALAAWIGRADGWMGLFVGWAALALLWAGTAAAIETVEFMALGAAGLLAVRALSDDRKQAAAVLLVGMGLFQVVYGLVQLVGLDPLWWGPYAIAAVDGVPGTLGNRGYFGWYVAMLTPLAPLWALPVFLAGVLLSKSVLAVLMVTAGLAWRFRSSRRTWYALAGGAAMVGVLAAWRGDVWLAGAWARTGIWRQAAETISGWGWLIGYGPGSWSVNIPAMERAAGSTGPVFFHAHNDVLQLLYEGGAVALVLLSGWIWTHRMAFMGRYGGCWVALLVGSLGHFGFRLAVTGATALVLLGLPLAGRQTEDA